MASLSPWAVLGVNEAASPATVRRAYKQLSLQVHPDRCPPGPARTAANEIFAELSTAYDTIRAIQESGQTASNFAPREEESQEFFSSEEYRRQFAAKFEEKLRAQGETDILPTDIFEALFGEAHRSFEFRPELPKAPDLEVPLPITLEELHTGCLKKMRISRKRCDKVTGILRAEPQTINIKVEQGWRTGDKIRFRGAGSEDRENYIGAQDVVFVLEEQKHDRFKRVGDDLHTKVDILLSDALCGVATHIDGVGGERIPVRVDTVTVPGSRLVLPHMGMSRRGKPQQRGELVVCFNVSFPERLTQSDKRHVLQVIGKIEGKYDDVSSSNIRRSASQLFWARSRETSDAQNATMPDLKRTTSRLGRKETNFTDNRSPSDTSGSRRRNRRSFGFKWRL